MRRDHTTVGRGTRWAAGPFFALAMGEYRKNKARAPGTEGTQLHTLGCKDSRARDFRGSGRGSARPA